MRFFQVGKVFVNFGAVPERFPLIGKIFTPVFLNIYLDKLLEHKNIDAP